MHVLMLVLLAAPVTRPLTVDELRLAAPSQPCAPDPKQSFHTTALTPSPAWVVTASCPYGLSVSLLKPGGEHLQSWTIGRGQLDAMAFDDLDHDGSAELILLGDGGLSVLSRQGDGYAHARGIESRATRLLGDHPAIPALRELMRPDPRPKPKLPKGLTLDCAEAPLPFAVSDDHRYGAWLGSTIDIHDFQTGGRPGWLTPRLQAVLDQRLQPGCEETQHEGPHGSGLRCLEPVSELDALVAGVQPEVHFVEVGTALTQDGGLPDGSVRVTRGGRPPVEIAARALECGAGEFPHVLGVLYGPGAAQVVFEARESGEHPLYECTPEEQETEQECFYSGGTCIHDVLCVPAPQAPPQVRMLTVPLR
ncbi:MAG: hypothetical protein QM723_23570 [Myxococcaceae bacterium]